MSCKMRLAARGAGLLLGGLLAAGPALAQSDDLPDQSYGMTGDWGGLRTQLENDGWRFQIREKWEGIGNLSGGDRQMATGASELRLGATADLNQLIGLPHAFIQLTVTDRAGSSLGPSAGLRTLESPMEVHGRGDRWRLTHLWYEQSFAGDRVNLKLGRVNPGIDFDAFSCHFENLTFCGAPPGSLVGKYWRDYPVSQWGGRLRLSTGKTGVYGEAGVYQVNPKDLTDGFNLSFRGQKGVLIPVEVGWTPKLGAAGLPGTWLIGGWRSTVSAPDVLLDATGAPIALTDGPPLTRHGRYGAYLSIEQQVTGKAKGPGLTLFLNATQADRRTTRRDRQIAIGASWKGLIPGRPKDEVALALGTTHINDRLEEGEALAYAADLSSQRPQDSEYVAELDYRWKPRTGLTVTPDLQLIRHVGGVNGRNAVLVGIKAVLRL